MAWLEWVWQGKVWFGDVRPGSAWQGRSGAWWWFRESSGHGLARQGMVVLDAARQGEVRRVRVRCGWARHGKGASAHGGGSANRHGFARRGTAGQGGAV